MHGQNPIRHKEQREDDKLQVAEIFQTLQGEAIYAGHPAVFIRLTGCNLACTFCDTSWDDINDPYVSIDEIVKNVQDIRPPACRLIVITGGEPLRQDLSSLIPALLKIEPHFHKIQIETAGTLWQDILYDHSVSVVVSPKTPKIHDKIRTNASAFKYVIKSGENSEQDGLPTSSTQILSGLAKIARPRPGASVYLSPCDEGDPELNLRNQNEVVRLAMQHGYIAGIQMHKIWNIR